MRLKLSEVKNFREQDGRRAFEAVALLRSRSVKTAKNSAEFLALEFGDNSAAIPAMCFEGAPSFAILKDAPVGTAFEIAATADFFNGRLSPKIDSARILSEAESREALPSLVPVSKLDPAAMKAELEGFVENISDAALRATVLYALGERGDFFTSVAAVKMHHAHMYGLLEHSLKMARTASALLPLYPFVDADLALAGCILHDIGKTVEYSQGLVADRTRIGMLQGHVVLGYRIVRRAGLKNSLAPDILARLEHIILSHQGEPEWGAAVRAATPEAVFVSTIDNFDAKMGALEAALDSAEGSEFVEVPALKVKMLADAPDYGRGEGGGDSGGASAGAQPREAGKEGE